jgi:hypothetical protein
MKRKGWRCPWIMIFIISSRVAKAQTGVYLMHRGAWRWIVEKPSRFAFLFYCEKEINTSAWNLSFVDTAFLYCWPAMEELEAWIMLELTRHRQIHATPYWCTDARQDLPSQAMKLFGQLPWPSALKVGILMHLQGKSASLRLMWVASINEGPEGGRQSRSVDLVGA